MNDENNRPSDSCYSITLDATDYTLKEYQVSALMEEFYGEMECFADQGAGDPMEYEIKFKIKDNLNGFLVALEGFRKAKKNKD